MEVTDEIVYRLKKNKLSYAWLIDKLITKENVAIDVSALSHILSGARKGPKAQDVIEASIKVLDWYDRITQSEVL